VLSVVSPYGLLSAFLLVVGALGLYTPGLMRLNGVHRPSTLFFLWDLSGRFNPGDSLQGYYIIPPL